jgi:hypothetical protein
MLRHVTTRLAGLVILIAGVWGGLIPFVGPYFHFTLGPDHTWTWTHARLYMDVIPGAVAVLGGLILLGAGPRMTGKVGALLGIAAGAWFAVGPDISRLWHTGGAQGVAHGGAHRRAVEYLTFHSGLGVLIAVFAAYALPGLLAYRAATAADAAAVGGATTAPAEPVGRRRFGFFGRRRAVTPAGQEPPTRRDVATSGTPADADTVRERQPAGTPERRF